MKDKNTKDQKQYRLKYDNKHDTIDKLMASRFRVYSFYKIRKIKK